MGLASQVISLAVSLAVAAKLNTLLTLPALGEVNVALPVRKMPEIFWKNVKLLTLALAAPTPSTEPAYRSGSWVLKCRPYKFAALPVPEALRIKMATQSLPSTKAVKTPGLSKAAVSVGGSVTGGVPPPLLALPPPPPQPPSATAKHKMDA